MLTTFLGWIVAIGWTLFMLGFGVSFWRNVRRYGFRGALTRLASFRFILPLLLVVGLTVLKLSLVFVHPQHAAVVISLLEPEGIRPQPLKSGLHFVVPLAEKALIYPIYWQTYTMSDRFREGQHMGADAIKTRTLDSQEVTMDVSIIYRIDPDSVVEVHRFWQDRYPEELLRPSVRGLLRREVAQYTVDQVNSEKRAEIEAQVDRALKHVGVENGLIVNKLLLRNFAFSKEYGESVEIKQVAMARQTQKEYEAKQIENLARGQASKVEIMAAAEANAIRVKADAQAEARLIKARAEAEALELVASALKDKQNLLTYRYISKLSPNVQAVVLPNDIPLIFPLPEMQVPPAPPESQEVGATN